MDGQAKANIKGMVAENNGVYTINIRVYIKEKPAKCQLQHKISTSIYI